MPSDGRFRVIVFGGDILQTAQLKRVNDLGEWILTELLSHAPTISLSPASAPQMGSVRFMTEVDPSVIDVLLIHVAQRHEVEILRDLHKIYHPYDAKLGWDYSKVFVDGPSYHEACGKAYEGYGVDPDKGAVVVVRPDGYVGMITDFGVDGRLEMRKWFADVLRAES
ncbi:Aromatic hydroxylase fmpF [Paramyrothecium foliicola]|nr:Aromatic hydroxylase fmpF [Paramyrothecium foliicola]